MDNSPHNSAYPSKNQHTHPASATRPVINAPFTQYPQAYPQLNTGAWTTGLCGCFEDCSSCCVGFWCPCVLVGRSVEVLDEGVTSCPIGGGIFLLLHALTGLGCLYTCIYRNKLRQKYGLPDSPCGDFCTDCCCLGCSICQVYREIDNRHMQVIPSGPAYQGAPTAPDFQHMSK